MLSVQTFQKTAKPVSEINETKWSKERIWNLSRNFTNVLEVCEDHASSFGLEREINDVVETLRENFVSLLTQD